MQNESLFTRALKVHMQNADPQEQQRPMNNISPKILVTLAVLIILILALMR